MCNSVRLRFFFFSDHQGKPGKRGTETSAELLDLQYTGSGMSDQVIKVSKLSGITNDLLGGIL